MTVEPVLVVRNERRYLIVHKREGIPFHAAHDAPGVLQIVREMEADGRIVAGERLFPVHRLDRITSGLLLFARGRSAANELGNEFRFGRVEKRYLALSDRKPKKKQGWVIGDMVRGDRKSVV